MSFMGLEDKAVDLDYVARVRKIAETHINGKRVIIQELLPWFGDFEGEVIIQAKETETNNLVAYAGFNRAHLLSTVRPNAIELRQLVISERYRRAGFGNAFLALLLHLGHREKIPFVLEPNPISGKPLGKVELTKWYEKHGFRKFSAEEVERHAHEKLMHEINRDLLFEGFEHSTEKLSGKKRYSLNSGEIDEMKKVPEEQRIALYRQHLIEQYGFDHSFNAKISQHRNTFANHLLREPTQVNSELISRFKINNKYRFPNNQRLGRAWKIIHKSEKKPRKRPEGTSGSHF